MEGSDCRLQSVSLCGFKSAYVNASFTSHSPLRQILFFMRICDTVIIFGPVCFGVDVYLGVYILMLVWNPKADATERMHVGAKYSLFQPQEKAWLHFHKSFVVVRELLCCH